MIYEQLPIILPIRHFLKDFFRSRAMSDLISYNVISKHASILIHWSATTFALKDNLNPSCTSYIASSLRKHKYQRLLEMLPTLEVMKKRHPLLYDSTSLCPRCSLDDETFYHIWLCSSVHYEMMDIILLSKAHLMMLTNSSDLLEIDRLPCWILSQYNFQSFITLIKGIVPVYLFKFINSKLQSQTLTYAACSEFMHFVYEKTQRIWNDRCQIQKDFETSSGITFSRKKEEFVSSGFKLFPNPNNDNLIGSMARLGSHWSNFWCRSDQALSCFLFYFFFFWKMIFLT
jgi:hypothetical protein